MRLPYAPIKAPESQPSAAAIYSAVEQRRAPLPLQDLDRTLLHAPPIAAGWNNFFFAIRRETTIPGNIRELVICRVAVLTQAQYEWGDHAGLARESGITDRGMDSIRTAQPLQKGQRRFEAGPQSVSNDLGLSEVQWAVVDYVDQMTKDIRVDEAVFQRLRAFFDEREIVEITSTAAAYNCVSRFLIALDVGERNSRMVEDESDK